MNKWLFRLIDKSIYLVDKLSKEHLNSFKLNIPVYKPAVLAFLMLILLSGMIFAQDKQKVYMQFSYVKDSDNARRLYTKVTRKEGRKKAPIIGLKIDIYLNEVTDSFKLGTVVSDHEGKATFLLPENIADNGNNEFNFIGRVQDNDYFKEREKSITIKEASIELDLYEEDSVRYVKALLLEANSETGEMSPAKDVEIKFFVKRMFSLLPIGGDYTNTDENGEVIIEFPNDIPKDIEGIVTIFAKLDDNDDYGTIETKDVINWGKAQHVDHLFNERSLWAQRDKAPLWLIFMADLTVILVWAPILFVVYLLFRIWRSGKLSI